MADNENENDNAEPQEEQPAKSSSFLMTIVSMVIVGLVCAGIGFAVPFFVPALVAGESTNEEATIPQPSFIPYGGAVANLDEERLNRYLRVSITLQIDQENEVEVTELVAQRKPILQSWLQRYLADKTMQDIRGAAGQNRLRREIQDQFNVVLFDDGIPRIHDVLFEEFNVQ